MQFLTLLFTLPAVNALLGLLWPGHRRWLGPLQTIGSAVLFAVTVGLAHHIVTVGPISLWQGSIYVDAFVGTPMRGIASAQAYILAIVVIVMSFLQFATVSRRVHYQ